MKKFVNYFSNLSFFEETHKYYIDSSPIKNSVSKICKNFVVEEDWDKIAYFVAKKQGKTKEEVLLEWKEKADVACDKGSIIHKFAEDYSLNKAGVPRNGYEDVIIALFKELKKDYDIVFPELQMYHKKYLFAGTCDLILYHRKSKTYVILDYKTNKDLFKNFKNKRLLEPFEDMLDNNYNKYQIQLSLYQILLEQTGVEVSERLLVWLKEDSYQIFKTENFTKKLDVWLQNNKVC